MKKVKKLFFICSIFNVLLIFLALFLFISKKSVSDKLKVYEKFEKVKKSENVEISYKKIEDLDNNYLTNDIYKCIAKPLKEDEYSDEMNNKIKEINNYFKSNSSYFSYEDLATGFSLDYGGKALVYAASTTKTALAQYIYNKAVLGEVDLDKMLVYDEKYYKGGSGILRYKEYNTKYSIRTLVEYMIIYSDNVALNILMDEFGMSNVKSYWNKLGVNSIYTLKGENFGYITANDSRIYLEQLYKFYKTNEQYGEELLNYYINSTSKYISNKNYVIANKYGEVAPIRHDTAIVFAKNPYALTILTNSLSESNYQNFYDKASLMFEELQKIYWDNKINICT